MTERQRISLNGYVSLLSDFVNGKLSSTEFESIYLQKFKNEQTELPQSAFVALDRFFADVDAYNAEPLTRTADEIGDKELLVSARTTLAELKIMITQK